MVCYLPVPALFFSGLGVIYVEVIGRRPRYYSGSVHKAWEVCDFVLNNKTTIEFGFHRISRISRSERCKLIRFMVTMTNNSSNLLQLYVILYA